MEKHRLNGNDPLLEDMRLSNMGKFFGIEVTEPELVDWRIFENAHIEGLRITGDEIPAQAWKWLDTIQGFERNFRLKLTRQILGRKLIN